MCDREQMTAWRGVNRREFGALGAAGAVAACAPVASADMAQPGLVETPVTFAADGGTMDGMFIHPGEGAHPAVILWPDIAGLRPAKIEMGRRMAAEGYAVLVANPYYRSVAGQQFADFADFRDNGGWDAVGPWRAANTPEAIMETVRSTVAWLDSQDAVDGSRGIGNQGYCMTGSWTVLAVAAVPDRVKAAGCFHGGGLTGDSALAPSNLLGSLPADAGVLVAIASDDDERAPDAKTILAQAGAAAAAAVTVEVYPAGHGWTVLDSPVYDEAEAERAWAQLLALYSATL